METQQTDLSQKIRFTNLYSFHFYIVTKYPIPKFQFHLTNIDSRLLTLLECKY
jgi:hypothetical protein